MLHEQSFGQSKGKQEMDVVGKNEKQSLESIIKHRILTERECFYYRMLSKSKKKIYHRCHEIQFMECLHEYFMYADLEKQHMRACLEQNNIMGTLWRIYLEREYLKVDTWEKIEELLDVFAAESQAVSWKSWEEK